MFLPSLSELRIGNTWEEPDRLQILLIQQVEERWLVWEKMLLWIEQMKAFYI